MSKRVLLVEPDEAVRASLTPLLIQAGYVVLTATCLDEALDALASGAPDGVLVADQQTGIDGYTLCRTLRAAGLVSPVLMLAAVVGDDYAAKACGVGVNAFLSKQDPPGELLERVAHFVNEGSA